MVKRVLLIEDEADSRQLVHDIIESEYDIVDAATAASGLALAVQTTPDLILMDVQLPDGEGLQTIRRFRAQENIGSIPIVVVSGLTRKTLHIETRAAGGTDFVAKPFTAANLLATIHQHIGRPDPAH